MAHQFYRVSALDLSLDIVEATFDLEGLFDGLTSATTPDRTYNTLPLLEPKSTRVLRILPPELQDEECITCQLEIISLDEDPFPEYCAVSYVWGSSSETRRITVNNKPFDVRKNLWTFLDHMRKQGFQGLLWIDAICINQACIPERNHQVSVMGDIYKCATRVLAWLGPESTIVADYAERFKRTPKMENLLQAPILDCIRLMTEELSKPLKFSITTNVVEKLQTFILLLQKMRDLFSAEYWSRTWIVQEYILARNISVLTDCSQMTGNELLTVWNTLVTDPTIHQYRYPSSSLYAIQGMSDVLDQLRLPDVLKQLRLFDKNELPPQIATILDLNEEVQSAFNPVQFSTAVQTIERRQDLHSASRVKPLEDWVARFQDLKCFDPRDHVYALLSLTQPEDLAFYELSPDYGKSELLLYIQLAYGLWMRGDFTRALLFGSVLGIKAEAVVQVNEKVRERALLDRSLGRQSSPQEVAKEIAWELYWRVTDIAPPQAPVLFRRQYPLKGRRRR